MKKGFLVFLALALMLMPFAALGEAPSLSDFEGTKIGAQTGAVFPSLVGPAIANVTFVDLDGLDAQVSAVKDGTVDAIALDQPVARLVVAQNDDLMIVPEVVVEDQYGFALTKGSAVNAQIDAAIESLREAGLLDEMADRWLGDANAQIPAELADPPADFDGSAGALKFGYDPVYMPMLYENEAGEPVGFDVELMIRVAYALNRELELVPVKTEDRMDSVISGTVDAVGGCMSITEERLKTVDFTVPYYYGGIVLVTQA